MANAGLYARAAKTTGAKGIFLDPEPYGTNPWDYSSSKYGGRSFAQVQAEVRQRGAQWMTALQNQYPDITVYTSFLMSMPMLKRDQDGSGLQNDMYALLPAFENGMLDVIGPNAKIVEGNEMAYYIKDTELAYNRAQMLKNPSAAYISPENMAKYKQQVKYGSAIWADGIINPQYYGFTASYMPTGGSTAFTMAWLPRTKAPGSSTWASTWRTPASRGTT